MSVILIVLIVVVALLAVLFAGGVIAAGRRARAGEDRLRERLTAANEALAQAHAEDKGWDRATVEAAARAAFAAEHGGAPIDELHLVQVVDKPGTDADQAVFVVSSGDTHHTVLLGRRDGAWVAI